MTPDCQDMAARLRDERLAAAEVGLVLPSWPVARRRCQHPGCRALLYAAGYCPAHRPVPVAR